MTRRRLFDGNAPKAVLMLFASFIFDFLDYATVSWKFGFCDDNGSSGASVVAIDNKIEQAMDLVKSHLMYAVREEVEVLKEQIKELIERNSQLEQENSFLKNLASPEQLAQFQAQVQTSSPTSATQPGTLVAPAAPLQSVTPNQGQPGPGYPV